MDKNCLDFCGALALTGDYSILMINLENTFFKLLLST